jgi:hypothetical protein
MKANYSKKEFRKYSSQTKGDVIRIEMGSF